MNSRAKFQTHDIQSVIHTLVILAFLALSVLAVVLSFGCAAKQTWPDQQRSAETKLFSIQGRIGDGLKAGTLTPDQSQAYLTSLKAIQTDYDALSGTRVYRGEWTALHGRLDSLETEVIRAQSRAPRIESPRDGERIVALQGRIDDGRHSGRLPQTEARDFQSRLDSIRRDYFRVTNGNRAAADDEKREISRRLDALEVELDRYR